MLVVVVASFASSSFVFISVFVSLLHVVRSTQVVLLGQTARQVKHHAQKCKDRGDECPHVRLESSGDLTALLEFAVFHISAVLFVGRMLLEILYKVRRFLESCRQWFVV